MKKGVYGYKLSRDTNERKALLKALVSSMIENGSLQTTLAKAKSIQPTLEKLVTKARKGSLTDRRSALRFLGKKHLVSRLFEVIGPAFKERDSGYTRIVKLGLRRGDGSLMVKLLFTEAIPLEAKETVEKNKDKKIQEPVKVSGKKARAELAKKTDK